MPVTYAYPRPALTVDALLIRTCGGQPEVLLVQRGHPPFQGAWALPGGFVDENEPLEAAARRELQEETGVVAGRLRQLHTFGDPGRDPRGHTVSVVFWGRVRGKRADAHAASDASDARWFPVAALPPLAFDHADIIRCAVARRILPATASA